MSKITISVEMNDEEYQEYRNFLENKDKLVKIDEINVIDFLNSKYETVSTNFRKDPLMDREVVYRCYKGEKIDITVRVEE